MAATLWSYVGYVLVLIAPPSLGYRGCIPGAYPPVPPTQRLLGTGYIRSVAPKTVETAFRVGILSPLHLPPPPPPLLLLESSSTSFSCGGVKRPTEFHPRCVCCIDSDWVQRVFARWSPRPFFLMLLCRLTAQGQSVIESGSCGGMFVCRRGMSVRARRAPGTDAGGGQRHYIVVEPDRSGRNGA